MLRSASSIARRTQRRQLSVSLRSLHRSARNHFPPTEWHQISRSPHGPHHSGSSGGSQSRHRHFPLRSSAGAGLGAAAAAALGSRGAGDDGDDNDGGGGKPPLHDSPWPQPAFRDGADWPARDSPSHSGEILTQFDDRYVGAALADCLACARAAQVDRARQILASTLHGDVVDEGPLERDVIWGRGRFVAREDTRVFWVPSPVAGAASTLCVSVHGYPSNSRGEIDVFIVKMLTSGVMERVIDKCTSGQAEHVCICFIHSAGSFVVNGDFQEELRVKYLARRK